MSEKLMLIRGFSIKQETRKEKETKKKKKKKRSKKAKRVAWTILFKYFA